jgi:hypothetical protein
VLPNQLCSVVLHPLGSFGLRANFKSRASGWPMSGMAMCFTNPDNTGQLWATVNNAPFHTQKCPSLKEKNNMTTNGLLVICHWFIYLGYPRNLYSCSFLAEGAKCLHSIQVMPLCPLFFTVTPSYPSSPPSSFTIT